MALITGRTINKTNMCLCRASMSVEQVCICERQQCYKLKPYFFMCHPISHYLLKA